MIEVAPKLATLYMPQMEQFHVELEPRGAVLAGAVDCAECAGTAWVLPISDHCLIVDHSLTPAHDVVLYENPSEPYACLCTSSDATIAAMPDFSVGNARPVGARTRGEDAVMSFNLRHRGGVQAQLLGGHTYRSRSICMFSEMFTELENTYPGEPFALFETFDQPWDEEAGYAIHTVLGHLSFERMMAPGAHLYARASVEGLVAELACARAAETRAAQLAGTHAATHLVRGVERVVGRALGKGHAPSLDEIAQALYVGRSSLCATFKKETGEAVGAYVRRQRLERACEQLACGCTVAEASRAAGYATPAAFTYAFCHAFGESPSAWAGKARS